MERTRCWRVKLFTGLVERTGRVVRVSGNILEVDTSTGMSSTAGDSLSVDGACLTVSSRQPGRLTFHCTRETLSRTIASGYHPGTMVNLEMPLEVGGRLHGHMVTGHVDCTAPVLKVERSGGGATVWISYPRTHARLLVVKGSIAVSGISLTVASLASDRFSVSKQVAVIDARSPSASPS